MRKEINQIAEELFQQAFKGVDDKKTLKMARKVMMPEFKRIAKKRILNQKLFN